MNEELLTQLREILQKNGVEEEVIEKSFDELAGEPVKEEPIEKIVEEKHEEPVEDLVDEMPVELEDEEAVVDEVADEPTEVVEEPVVEEPVEEPALDEEIKTRLDEAWGEIEELKKANEGLLARISSLEEALANAGVIDQSLPTSNEMPGRSVEAPSNEDLGNPMDNFLARVRKDKRY